MKNLHQKSQNKYQLTPPKCQLPGSFYCINGTLNVINPSVNYIMGICAGLLVCIYEWVECMWCVSVCLCEHVLAIIGNTGVDVTRVFHLNCIEYMWCLWIKNALLIILNYDKIQNWKTYLRLYLLLFPSYWLWKEKTIWAHRWLNPNCQILRNMTEKMKLSD